MPITILRDAVRLGAPALRRLAAPALLFSLAAWPAAAYVGPGAGFAVLSSGLLLVGTVVLALAIVAAYPFKLLWRFATGKGRIRGKVKRLVILGFDGMDPELAARYMEEGRLPNLNAMKERGHFGKLASSCPSISPVAWSSFATGVDASRHNIFDFITRDPCTYLPVLSSTEIKSAEEALVRIGRFEFLKRMKTTIRLMRKARSWWGYLGDQKIFSNILRVPITFPPKRFHGALLSGMCVPDLKGTQGSFSFFTTSKETAKPEAGGDILLVSRDGDQVSCRVKGPDDGDKPSEIPMLVTILEENRRIRIKVGSGKAEQEFELGIKEYSPWIPLEFKVGKAKAMGIGRFYCMGTAPEFDLYLTPIQIDPGNPAMPISHPAVYAIYLAKKLGPYATLGLAEDTWALNERVIDEEAFYRQAMAIWEERRKQLHDALSNTRKGSVVCVFDGTDRVSHMFFRYLDPAHPANADKETEWGRDKVREIYEAADRVVGEVKARLKPERDLLLVISDHGFCQFKRGVDINSWLRDNGFLSLKEDAPVDDKTGVRLSRDWCQDVDWTKTKAFSLGLTGIFINRAGRERNGTVEDGEELDTVKRQIREGLMALVDEKNGERVFREVSITSEIMNGPYLHDAPDLLLGYRRGYRSSWSSAKGAAAAEVLSDNTKSWSGDHCVDPREVPGVIFSDVKIDADDPNIRDLGPTALSVFGMKVPPHMQGKSLLGHA